MNQSLPIVPALIPVGESEVREFALVVEFAREIQIDVVDGIFVPTTSWPYEPNGEPKHVRQYTDRYTLEVDLMVQEPLAAAEDWLDAGVDMLVFHCESLSLEQFKKFKNTHNVSVGAAYHGGTTYEYFAPYAALADYVQLMGVRTIGAQGQNFDDKILKRIKQVKADFPEKMISVDGSVNENTIERLKEVGATRFVSGSAILAADNPAKAFSQLTELVSK